MRNFVLAIFFVYRYFVGMFSACVIVDDHGEGLTRTLSALVPAVADGYLRDCSLVDYCGSVETANVADACGANLVAAKTGLKLQSVAGPMRGDWMLLLMAGVVPQPGWHFVASEFANRAMQSDAARRSCAAFDYASPGFRQRDRMREAWRAVAGRLFGSVVAGQGLLIEKRSLMAGRDIVLNRRGWSGSPRGTALTVLPAKAIVPA